MAGIFRSGGAQQVTQVGNAAISSPSATGASVLATPIDITKAYWIIPLGVTTSGNTLDGARLSSFDGTTLTFTRSHTVTTQNLTVQYLVTGTPA